MIGKTARFLSNLIRKEQPTDDREPVEQSPSSPLPLIAMILITTIAGFKVISGICAKRTNNGDVDGNGSDGRNNGTEMLAGNEDGAVNVVGGTGSSDESLTDDDVNGRNVVSVQEQFLYGNVFTQDFFSSSSTGTAQQQQQANGRYEADEESLRFFESDCPRSNSGLRRTSPGFYSAVGDNLDGDSSNHDVFNDMP